MSGYTTDRKPIEIGSDGGYDFLLALDENLEEDDKLLQSVKVYFNIYMKNGFEDLCILCQLLWCITYHHNFQWAITYDIYV